MQSNKDFFAGDLTVAQRSQIELEGEQLSRGVTGIVPHEMANEPQFSLASLWLFSASVVGLVGGIAVCWNVGLNAPDGLLIFSVLAIMAGGIGLIVWFSRAVSILQVRRRNRRRAAAARTKELSMAKQQTENWKATRPTTEPLARLDPLLRTQEEQGMMLSRGQRRVLLVGIVLFAIVGVFPPWVRKDSRSGFMLKSNSVSVKSLGHGFIGNPPVDDDDFWAYSFTIDYPRLLIEWAVVCVLTAGFLLLSGGKKKTVAVTVVAFLALASGCQSRDQRDQMKRDRELSEARYDLSVRLMSHNLKSADKKIPLLAAKYGIPETAVRDFVNAYAVEQMHGGRLMDIFAITNLVRVQELRAQLDSIPPVSDTVIAVSAKHGLDSKVLASLLVDYYTWLSAESKGLGQ